MDKYLEQITTTVLLSPTATSALTGTVAVDMKNYSKAVAKLFAHRLPDAKGEGVMTLSVYENTVNGVTGTIVTASIKTASITSASDVYLVTELKDIQLSKNGNQRYITAHVSSSTPAVVSMIIDRTGGRYDPQQNV
jgi:hypothetical protein